MGRPIQPKCVESRGSLSKAFKSARAEKDSAFRAKAGEPLDLRLSSARMSLGVTALRAG